MVDFEPGTEFPIVEFRNGKNVTMVPDAWELRDGDKKRASINQIPLRLAWAITVHKSQGMTLDAAKIDLRKAFVPGMGYVALSRVKSLEGIFLYGINRTALKISEDALAIDDVLRTKSAADHKRFKHLESKALERAKAGDEPVAKKKQTGAGSWADKIAKMRETYPNAYKTWTSQEDELLKQDFQLGKSVKELSTELGRHEGSITIRLQKHFGEDVILP